VVRSGKLRRKPFNSNVADYLLIIATAGRPADHGMSISLTNGRKLGAYITSTNCTCTDARCWWSRLKLRTSAPGLSHSEEPRADPIRLPRALAHGAEIMFGVLVGILRLDLIAG